MIGKKDRNAIICSFCVCEMNLALFFFFFGSTKPIVVLKLPVNFRLLNMQDKLLIFASAI